MINLVLPMGAEHTNRENLMRIIHTIEKEAKDGMFEKLTYSPHELNRINDIYIPHDSSRVARPGYQYITFVDEEKLDGFSYTCNNGEFYSRKLSEAKETKGMPICKTGHVKHLADDFKRVAASIDFDLHGELYKVRGTSDDVTRIMGCTEDKAIERQMLRENKLHYMVHDIRRFNGYDLTGEPWYIRRAILEWIFTTQLFGPYIHLSRILGSPIESFNRIVSGGGEGIILKRTTGLYVPGKKPANNWIKCKKELTSDVIITGFNDGTGKNKDLFGSMIFSMYVDGQLKEMGNVSSGITDELRNQIAANPDSYIGRVIEIEAMQGSGKSFRHPRFKRLRIDKNREECTWDNVTTKMDLL